jgi:hypothetical protein
MTNCRDTGPSSFDDVFNSMANDYRIAFRTSMFRENAKLLPQTGSFCYDESQKETGMVVFHSLGLCIYDRECRPVAIETSSDADVDVVHDLAGFIESLSLSDMGIKKLEADLSTSLLNNAPISIMSTL